MSRQLCSLMLALSVGLLAFGPTAAFAVPPCTDNCFAGNSKHQKDSCTNNGCTEVDPGQGKHCFTGPDHKC